MPISTGPPVRTREAAEWVLRDFRATGASPELIAAAVKVVEAFRRAEKVHSGAVRRPGRRAHTL